MRNRIIAPLVAAAVFWSLLALSTLADAQTLTWGPNGAGGSGNWDTTTAGWFNGTQNVVWASGGNAIFGGATGGTVTSVGVGPVVTSMTFNTPGYVIQGGQVRESTSGLTVTTNVDATISAALAGVTKNGLATLIQSGLLTGTVTVNQGEVRIAGTSNLFEVNLANAPGVALTLAQPSSIVSTVVLSGGGTSGGVIRPADQPRTVTLEVTGGSSVFNGVLEDNGSGILATEFMTGQATEALTNANTYSGSTTVNNGALILSGNGTALNSSSFFFLYNGGLTLDDSGTIIADRISESSPIFLEFGGFGLKGNKSTAVEEKFGQLAFNGQSNVTVQSNGAAAQMTFAAVQRIGHSALAILGPGIQLTGLSNNAAGILPPFITDGFDWATVGADGRVTALTTYSTDINSGSANDNVKITALSTVLAAPTTRGSLNFQNLSTSIQTLDLSGQTLVLTTGGILTDGNARCTIANGAISSGGGDRGDHIQWPLYLGIHNGRRRRNRVDQVWLRDLNAQRHEYLHRAHDDLTRGDYCCVRF